MTRKWTEWIHGDVIEGMAEQVDLHDLPLSQLTISVHFDISAGDAQRVIRFAKYLRGCKERLAELVRKREQPIWREALTWDESGGLGQLSSPAPSHCEYRALLRIIERDPVDKLQDERSHEYNPLEFRTRQPWWAYRRSRRLHWHRALIIHYLSRRVIQLIYRRMVETALVELEAEMAQPPDLPCLQCYGRQRTRQGSEGWA
jgi:hypothetical protein